MQPKGEDHGNERRTETGIDALRQGEHGKQGRQVQPQRARPSGPPGEAAEHVGLSQGAHKARYGVERLIKTLALMLPGGWNRREG